mgnify:CR=1 FL=1
MVLCRVKLSACRDHILQGILTFLSIPFFNILTNEKEFTSIGNKGVYLPFIIFVKEKTNSFLLQENSTLHTLISLKNNQHLNSLRRMK